MGFYSILLLHTNTLPACLYVCTPPSISLSLCFCVCVCVSLSFFPFPPTPYSISLFTPSITLNLLQRSYKVRILSLFQSLPTPPPKKKKKKTLSNNRYCFESAHFKLRLHRFIWTLIRDCFPRGD